MTRTDRLYQWSELVTSRFRELSRAECAVLAWYSFGMILARASGVSAIALVLAVHLGRRFNTVRQRLRELYQPAHVKSGRGRRDLDVTLCFAPLLRWITSGWTDRRLVVALDPTHVGDRFIVLAVSVVYRGCAIPVAWHVVAAQERGGWNEHWIRLFSRVKAALGSEWQVLVLTDRGLESRALFAGIVESGGHPLMRAKAAGTFRPDGWHRGWPMARFASAVGRRWRGRGVAYRGEAALACTLLACWDEPHAEPWLLLTDLAPSAANPAWYAFRAWIEQGFKVLKSGGWQWQRSRVTDPQRAARQWAALALATLWLIEVGGEAEPLLLPAGSGTTRAHRLFSVGLAMIIATLIAGNSLPCGSFRPQRWTRATWKSDKLPESTMHNKPVYP